MAGQYEDRWFIEVDLAAESPSKIVAKCKKYHKYYRAGLVSCGKLSQKETAE